MATMPDTLTVNIVNEPVVKRCFNDEDHNFREAPTFGSWMMLFCTQCGMMVDVRFEDASGS